jgi:hypothetical protein
MGMISKEALDNANAVALSQKADIYLYNAPISRDAAEAFCCTLKKITPKRKSAALILATLGGDPDGAFLIARCLQRTYGKYSVYIFGQCKSAGTLIVIGASEVIMADSGELGPLDIQVGKEDEIFVRSSGLDLAESIKYLRDLASEEFFNQFVRMKAGGSITTKTAADIAQALALGLSTPILSQIDPLRLGELQRSMRIAREYGKILNPEFPHLDRLISTYPSHGFVIDREQAKRIFKNIRMPTDKETDLNETLGHVATQPLEQGVIEILTQPEQVVPPSPAQSETPQPSEENENNSTQQSGSNGDAGAPATAGAALSSRR